jgi:ankyrin repeat protein
MTTSDVERDRDLGRAVRDGRIDDVGRLLDAGADPNLRGQYGDTFLQMALDRNHTTMAFLLETAIARSPRTRPADTGTDHQIHVLAEAGDLARVRRLLDADPAMLNQGDREGATPLQRAIIGRARAVVRLLLDRGADIHAMHPGPEGLRHVRLQAIDFAIWGAAVPFDPYPLAGCSSA